MPHFHTHLCLVSAQATPNLLPVLDTDWRPSRVVLAASPQMQPAANALAGVIRRKATGIEVCTLPLANAYDYAALCDTFLEFLSRNESTDVALNVTGGTKLMAVAAQEVFRANGLPVLYVNVDTDGVVLLGEPAPLPPLQAQLKVHELLESHGLHVASEERPQVSAAQRDLCNRVVDYARSAGSALGALNWLAALAEKAPDRKVEVHARELDSKSFESLVAQFEEAGQLRLQGTWLSFPSEAARRYVNGGWLETYVYQTLQDLRGTRPGITDVAMNVVIEHADRTIRNEVDVAFLYRNTLHLIECKTANLGGTAGTAAAGGGDGKAAQVIYKMEALLKLGGLRTRGMIVDYRGSLAVPEHLQRAAASRIEVVGGKKLGGIKEEISRLWMHR